MDRSEDQRDSVTEPKSAVQQSRAAANAPRPLPLFLELVRVVAKKEPELAAKAMEGLAKYEDSARPEAQPERPEIASVGAATLRDCGGSGPPVLLVPSLINPPDILDLDGEVSLAEAVASSGRHALLLDWGPARERSELDVAGHVETLLVPLLGELGEPPSLVGYCLGGTMAIAAANLGKLDRVVTLAAPWRFSAYPEASRNSLLRLWDGSKSAAQRLQALPMEVLQSAFWSLDPMRTVAKFAAFAELPAGSDQARRFVTLEDWANKGEPLPYPAARELIEDLFGSDLAGKGEWRVGGRSVTDAADCPILNVTASSDRITPAAAAPAGNRVEIDSGHVGMVVGSARNELHGALAAFLKS